MKFVFTLVFIFTLTILSLSHGLDNTSQDLAAPDKRALMAQGQLMSLQVIPADKSAKIYVLGKKVAESKSAFRPLILKATAFNQDQEEELKVTPEGDYFTVQEPKLGKPYSLRVKAQLDQKEEKFEVHIPKSIP